MEPKSQRSWTPQLRRKEQHSFLLLLVFCLDAWQAAGQAPAPVIAPGAAAAVGRTVNVSDDVAFAAAMADPSVGTIKLVANVTLRDTSAAWTPYQPLLRTANLTVHSFCAPNCSMDEFFTLDFAFLSSLVLLDVNVTVRLDYMVIANLRKVAGVGVDLFLGRQGSAILTSNCIASRLACSPTQFQSQVLQNATAAAAAAAAAPIAPQQQSTTVLDSFCWRGKCYDDTLRYVNYAAQVPPSNSEASLSVYGSDAGYHFVVTNGTRLCASYWPSSCLNTMTADACNIYYINQALQQQQSSDAGQNPAIIAVPVAVGVALLGGVLAVLFMRRQIKQRTASTAHSSGKDVESGNVHSSDTDSHKGHVLSFVNGPPLLNQQSSGWQLMARHTSPALEGMSLADDKIELGVLLGAGSSGRVYRARWRDQDVAVKVLQHDAQTAALVANETDLMMGFDDRNIVRAFHVVSWRQASGHAADRANERGEGNTSTASTGHAGTQRGEGNTNTASTSATPPGSVGAPAAIVVDKAQREKRGSQSGMPRSTLSVRSHSGSISHSGALHVTSGSNIFQPQLGRRWQAQDSIASSSVMASGAVSGAVGIVETTAIEDDFLDDGDSGSFNVLAQTWLIQEFCDGGTLADAVRAGRYRRSDGQPDMAKILIRLHDVASGMRYLHARNVLHRDLKACNVLLMTDPTAPFGCIGKVADFGLSYMMRPGQTHHSTRTLGTISHMAPELLRAGKQSPAADVYAFGIVMWELVSGRSAFGNAHYGEVFERVAILGERPTLDLAVQQAIGEEYMLLMQACWEGDPALRPTFEQVCEGLELLQQHHMGLANGDVAGAAGGAGTGAALTLNLSRHWNIVAQAPQQPEPEPVHGFF